MQWNRDGFEVNDNRDTLDLDVVHTFLTSCYWAEGIKLERVKRATSNSECFGLYTSSGEMIGFGRVLTDFSSIAYLMDVFVIEEYRGQGLGKWLVECILGHEPFKPVRRWMLGTLDAHSLYERYGFTPYDAVADLMMRYDPDKFKND